MSAITSEGWVRTRASDPCPICKRTKFCLYNRDRNIAVCTKVESGTRWEGMHGWAHALDGGEVGRDWRDARPLPPPTPKPTLDPDLCDRAYRAMLAALPLSPEHRAAMIGRGMSAAEVEAGGYGSLPADEGERTAALAAVADAIGGDPLGRVPGFARRRNGSVGIFAAAGMLVPVRDLTGRVRGLRVRVDDPDAARSGKYRHLSGGEDGATIDGNALHVALPIGGTGGRIRSVVVVEGEIKANIVANRMRLPVLGLAGVDCIGQVVDHLRLLDEGGGIEVAVAFDADKRDNPDVARAEHRLVAALRLAGYRAVEWSWERADGKGLDDLLAQDYMPHPALYPDDLPLADAPPSEETQRMLREVRDERDRYKREAHLITRITAKRNLGGDVGNTVAVRTINYAGTYAAANNLQPGDVVPLVAKKIADDIYDPEKGETLQAVSDTTVGRSLRKFIDSGLFPTIEATHTYTDPNTGRPKTIKVPGLVWSDRLDLLERVANGSVLEDGEERNRGGKREKRAPLVCPSCGGAHVACTGCGEVFDAVVPEGDAARLVNMADPEPAPEGEDGQRRLLDGGGAERGPDNNAPTGDVYSVQVRRGWSDDDDPGWDDDPHDGMVPL